MIVRGLKAYSAFAAAVEPSVWSSDAAVAVKAASAAADPAAPHEFGRRGNGVRCSANDDKSRPGAVSQLSSGEAVEHPGRSPEIGDGGG
jgi:hypothetical protein